MKGGSGTVIVGSDSTLETVDAATVVPSAKVEFDPILVEVRKLSKYYQRGGQVIPVLVDIDLDVRLGDFAALMGP